MLSAINFKQIPLISVFKGCNVVSELACFLLINLSSQGQIDDMLFAGDNIYLNSFCLKKKKKIYLLIYLFLSTLGLPCCAWTVFSCAAWASHCGGFSCCRRRLWVLRLQQLWRLGSRVRAE